MIIKCPESVGNLLGRLDFGPQKTLEIAKQNFLNQKGMKN